MKKFFRIQQKTSPFMGPYQTLTKSGRSAVSSLIRHRTGLNLYCIWRCPAPPTRFAVDSNYRYGFSSLTALKKWFGCSKAMLKVLEQEDFEIVEYSVRERFDAETQSVVNYFDGEGKKIRSVPFTEINPNFVAKKS